MLHRNQLLEHQLGLASMRLAELAGADSRLDGIDDVLRHFQQVNARWGHANSGAAAHPALSSPQSGTSPHVGSPGSRHGSPSKLRSPGSLDGSPGRVMH